MRLPRPVVDLQERPWEDRDGQVRDAHGSTWLIGSPRQ